VIGSGCSISVEFVIPAQAGLQGRRLGALALDPDLRRGDDMTRLQPDAIAL
jgi:hypothetical protein